MKRLPLLLVAVLLLLTAIAALLPFSAPGTRLLIATASRIDGLSIDYVGGQVFGELRLGRIRLETAGLELEVEQLRTELMPGCLLQSRFCLQAVDASSVSLALAGSQDEPAEEAATAEPLELPFSVSLDALNVASVAIEWPGGAWHGNDLHLQVLQLAEGSLDVRRLALADSQLSLAPQAPQEEPSPGLPDIVLPLDLRFAEVVLERSSITTETTELVQTDVIAALAWDDSGLAVENLALTLPEQGRAELTGKLTPAGDWPLKSSAAWRGRPLAVPEELPWPDRLSLEASGSLARLALELRAEGPLSGSVDARAGLLQAHPSFSASGQLTAGEGLALEALLGAPAAGVTLRSPLRFDLSGTEASQQLRAAARFVNADESESLSLELDVALAGDRLEMNRVTLRNADGGRLEANGGLALAPQRAGSFDVKATDFSVAGFVPPEWTVRDLDGTAAVTLEVADPGWVVAAEQLDLTAELRGQDISVSGRAGFSPQEPLPFGRATVRWKDARLEIDRAAGQSGTLLLDLPELATLTPELAGSLRLAATYGPDSDLLDVKGSGRDIRSGDNRIGALDLDGVLNWRTQSMFEFTFTASDTRTAAGATDVQGEAALRGGEAEARVVVAGDLTTTAALTAQRDGSDWRGAMAPLSLAVAGHTLQSQGAIDFQWHAEEGQLTLADHCWNLDDLSACLSEARLGARGELRLEASGPVDLASADAAQPWAFRADIDLDAALAWDELGLSALDGRGTLTGISLDPFTGDALVPPIAFDRVQLTLDQDEQQRRLLAQVESTQWGNFSSALTQRLSPERDPAGLDGHLTFDDLSLAPIRDLVPDLDQLEGRLNGELDVKGTWRRPRLEGTLGLVDGAARLAGSPSGLREFSANLLLAGEEASLDGSGLLGDGVAEVSGRLRPPGQPSTLAFSGERNRLHVPDLGLDVLLSPDLMLVLKDDLLDVSGNITVHEGLLEHEQLPPGSVRVSSDTVLVNADELTDRRSVIDVSGDVQISVRDNFRIMGEQVDATLGGELQLLKAPTEPAQIFGRAGVIGGELRAYGQRLRIRRGNFAFAGDPTNPGLDLQAEREIIADQVRVGFIVGGDLETPSLELYSDPDMPQQDMLSYLLRGRPPDVGAQADSTALALSVGASALNQSGVLEGLNRTGFLNSVTLGASGSDDETMATISGYVGDRIYLSYGIGLYEPVNALTARIYLQTRLWLEVVSRLDNSVDLYYSFDVD